MERVVANLNRALYAVMESDDSVFLIGEDLRDPYGGAFKVSRGLSTAFPDRVISTPISENGLLGVANGLALSGEKAIAEIMFGDFTLLAMDQIVNFAAKSVTMYGERMNFPLLVRCPMGGHRGYGATHSQTLSKHFLGVPNLTLFELSPVHDLERMLRQILETGTPAIHFEDKTLYTHRTWDGDQVGSLYRKRYLDEERRLVLLETGEKPEVLLVTGGGMLPACLEAGRRLLEEADCAVDILVPYQIYPFDADAIAPLLEGRPLIATVEEGTAGGTWGGEVAKVMHDRYWELLPRPVKTIHSKDSIIPSARHLEEEVLVSVDQIVREVVEELD